ncbi:Metallo-dependent phosphatase-like protein [Pholiota molesta]|nr:Metallo-dependent phosphatase-like protein [Pholiota molesta]
MPSKVPEYSTIVLSSTRENVHLEYTPSQLPPKPSDEWTRFVCISDTHAHAFAVPDGDVLLHSGDLTNTGTLREFEKTMDWLYSLPHRIKIIIAGNHDLTLHTEWYEQTHMQQHREKQAIEHILTLMKGPRADEAGIIYLRNEEYEFQTKDGGRIWSAYGSPWSPEFCDWAFNYPREEGETLVAKFPKTDILLTHGPPYEILDRTNGGQDVGQNIAGFMYNRNRALSPCLHLFGHIHEAHGAYIHTWDPALEDAPPMVQNTDPSMSSARAGEPDAEPPETALDTTVFVNTANYPTGKKAYRPGVRPLFGGPGFQAVVEVSADDVWCVFWCESREKLGVFGGEIA